MSQEIDTTDTLDVRGESCPMPVIKTKSAIDTLEPGAVLEVIATDAGSMSDIKGWANATDSVELLDQFEESADEPIYRHFIRKIDTEQ